MCYKKPGPRCSAHAEERLSRLQSNLSDVTTEFRSVAREYKSAVTEYKVDSDNKVVANKARNLRKTLGTLKIKKESLDQEVHLAQRDFDGTRKGQKILTQQINDFDKENGEFNDFVDLSNRRTAGKMFYSWRKNQLELQEQASKSGKSLKERRGKFLTMSDRSGEPIEVDEQMLEAITNINTPHRMRKLVSA